MASFTIRPRRVPDDFPAVAAILTATQPEPVTAEELAQWEAKVNPKAIRVRLIAVDDAGQALGIAGATHNPWNKEGKFYGSVTVLPEHRHQGVGSALFEAIESFVREQGAHEFEGEVRDNDPDSRAFLERRGFAQRRHLFESTLDLSTFDPSRFAGVTEATGLRITTLAETGGEEMEHRLYEAFMRNLDDIPGFESSGNQSFADWRSWTLEGEAACKDCIIFALDGDHIAGITTQQLVKATGAMYTHHTSVTREYRGRNLSLALKLVAIENARRHGARYMRTNNDAENIPMLTVNRKLGYVPAPGVFFMQKMF